LFAIQQKDWINSHVAIFHSLARVGFSNLK
jgi:hypothetical protein